MELTKNAYACVSPDTIVNDILPGKTGVENTRALFWYPEKGVESVHIQVMRFKTKRSVLLMFDTPEKAQGICDAANKLYGSDLQVKVINP